jgi:Leucine-rich repeat (LRR) protein
MNLEELELEDFDFVDDEEEPEVDEVFNDTLTDIDQIRELVIEDQDVKEIEYIDVSDNDLNTLPSFKIFVNLNSLYCGMNNLRELPELPNELKGLFCQHNQLTQLKLPNKLQILNCDMNLLRSLPSVLPSTLRMLSCEHNSLSQLPNLPNEITTLNCSENILKYLPDPLPLKLTSLIVNNNQLMTLPKLPNTLSELRCDENQIVNIPNLPESLESFSCKRNKLENLPQLPNNLEYVNCSHNRISELPRIPDNLNSLYCKKNRLTSLSLKHTKLTQLNCSHNNITELTELPTTLTYLNCSNNRLTFISPYIANSLEHLRCDNNKLPYHDLESFKEWAASYILNSAMRRPRLKRQLVSTFNRERIFPELLAQTLNPRQKFNISSLISPSTIENMQFSPPNSPPARSYQRYVLRQQSSPTLPSPQERSPERRRSKSYRRGSL